MILSLLLSQLTDFLHDLPACSHNQNLDILYFEVELIGSQIKYISIEDSVSNFCFFD